MFFRRLIRNKLAVLGAVLLLFLTATAVLAPGVATQNPFKLNLKDRFQSPSSSHFFGSDGYGRDLFSRVVYGAAIATRKKRRPAPRTASLFRMRRLKNIPLSPRRRSGDQNRSRGDPRSG